MRLITLVSAIAASGMLAYLGSAWVAPEPASAEESAEYPEHIRLEQEAQLVERQKKVQKLKHELEEIRDSDVTARLKKAEEFRKLLVVQKGNIEIIREEPSLAALYQVIYGDTAGVATADILPGSGFSEGDSFDQFCGCLTNTRVKWLGKNQQAGETVLEFGGHELELKVGDKVGKSLCALRNTTPTHATLECRDPIADKKHLKHIALQTLPR